MDTAAIDAAGLRPLWPYLAQIDAVKTQADLVALMGRWRAVRRPADGPRRRPRRQGSDDLLGRRRRRAAWACRDRDYYLKNDERFAKARTAYVAYMRKLLAAQGSRTPRRRPRR